MSERKKAKRPQWDKEHIQSLRRHLEMTQQEMAEQMGTRQQTISEWETGMYEPRGASTKLLTIIAERAKFRYQAVKAEKEPKIITERTNIKYDTGQVEEKSRSRLRVRRRPAMLYQTISQRAKLKYDSGLMPEGYKQLISAITKESASNYDTARAKEKPTGD